MAQLSRDQVLAYVGKPLRVETVKVPEWGGELLVREWSGEERDAFEMSFVLPDGTKDPEATKNLRAKLVARSVVDDQGHHQFHENDVDQLGTLSAKALDRVFNRARKLHGMTADDVAELEKN